MPGGNPNHDPKTGEFTSGEGGGNIVPSSSRIDSPRTPAFSRTADEYYRSINPKLGTPAHAAGTSTGDATSDRAVSLGGKQMSLTRAEYAAAAKSGETKRRMADNLLHNFGKKL